MPKKTSNLECTVEEMFIGLDRLATIAKAGVVHSGLQEQVEKLVQLFDARYGNKSLEKEKLNEILPKEIAEAYRPLAIVLGTHLHVMNVLGMRPSLEDQKIFFCYYEDDFHVRHVTLKPFYINGECVDIT
ncbi:MAG: hypothetical protein AABW41_00860 [Nanoarchaeota archaeon]